MTLSILAKGGNRTDQLVPDPERAHGINWALPGGEYGGKFCCGTYDANTTLCAETHNGTRNPFTLGTGYVYFPNTSTILETYAEEVSNNKSSLAANLTDPGTNANCSTKTSGASLATETVGIATGVALGASLLVAVILLICKWGQVKTLKRELAGVHTQKQDHKMEHWQDDGVARNDQATLLQAKQTQQSYLTGHEYELSIDHTVSEMPHQVIRQELAGH